MYGVVLRSATWACDWNRIHVTEAQSEIDYLSPTHYFCSMQYGMGYGAYHVAWLLVQLPEMITNLYIILQPVGDTTFSIRLLFVYSSHSTQSSEWLMAVVQWNLAL